MWAVTAVVAVAPHAGRKLPRRNLAVEEKDQQRQMSGSDVVMALQRATTNKFNSRPPIPRRNKDGDNNGNGNGDSDAAAAAAAAAICINPQWTHRLDQLERRLHQLSRTLPA